MEFFPVKTPIISQNDELVEILSQSLPNNKLELQDGDILIFAETVVGTTQNRILNEDELPKPTDEANRIAKKFNMNPNFVQLIIEQSDAILGGVKGVLLTENEGVLIANAGVDQSNAGGEGKYSLFPSFPSKTAFELREKMKSKFKIENLGIIISDSRVQPMRKGTVGVAIGVAGIEPIDDCVGRKDLFGRPLEITKRAMADNLVSAAQILMGESDEQIPIVLVRNAPVKYTDRFIDIQEMLMSRDRCLFMNVFRDLAAYKNPEYKNIKKNQDK